MNKEKMGEYLIALRTEKGLTQQEEAELFSVTPQAVSKWELGLSAPDIETLEKLSRFYGVSINEILNGEPMKEKAKTVSPFRARVLSRLASFICTCSFFFLPVNSQTASAIMAIAATAIHIFLLTFYPSMRPLSSAPSIPKKKGAISRLTASI